MLKAAASMILALVAAIAPGDVEKELARLLGDSSSATPAFLAGLKLGMSPAEARQVFPGLPASVKGAESVEIGRVEMKHPLLDTLALKFFDGRLKYVAFEFRRDMPSAAFKAASVKLMEAKWAVPISDAERERDGVHIFPGGQGVSRSWIADHWELDVQLPGRDR